MLICTDNAKGKLIETLLNYCPNQSEGSFASRRISLGRAGIKIAAK